MSVFSVEPSALTSYAEQINRARDDVRLIGSYLTNNATDGTGGEIFSVARAGNQQAVEAIEGAFTWLTCLLDNSAPELRAAAVYYQRTDRSSAANLDHSLPEGAERCPNPVEYEIAANACKPPPLRRLPGT